MKRLLLLSFVAMSLFACKDDKKDTPTPAIDYKDPKVLSGALTIQSGTAVTGAMPAGNGANGAPVLNTDQNNEIIHAITGRYVVVSPELMSGTFKGYYVQVTGADSHFKIEFPAKAGGRKAANRMHSLLRADGPDSLIVIKLPEGLNIDTFKIQYAAYDSSNVVSNVITAYVALLKPAGGADGAAFAGTWEHARYKNADDADWRNNFAPDTNWTTLGCRDTAIIFSVDGTRTINSISKVNKEQFAFNANGSFTFEYQDTYSYIDWTNSRCGNLKYKPDDYTSVAKGGWSYVAASKELVIIGDFDGSVLADDFEVVVFPVKEATASRFLVEEKDGFLNEFIKK